MSRRRRHQRAGFAALARLVAVATAFVALPAEAGAADRTPTRPVGVAPPTLGADEAPLTNLGTGISLATRLRGETGAGRAGRAGVPGAGIGRRTVLVLRTYYEGEGWPPTSDPSMEAYTSVEVERRVTGSDESARAMYAAQSNGLVTLAGATTPAADVSDWLRFSGALPRTTSGECNDQAVGQQVLARATSQGIAWAGYGHVVILFPYLAPSQCSWAGKAQVGGRIMWINGFVNARVRDEIVDGAVIAHEIGHNLGVAHAASLACTEPGADAQTAVLTSTGCSRPVSTTGYPSGSGVPTQEYGDPFDMMGTLGYAFAWRGSELMSTWHRAQTLQLPDADQQVVTTERTVTLQAANAADGTRLIRIPRGVTSTLPELALEYRPAATAFDRWDLESGFSPAPGGVLVRLVPAITSPSRSFLLDATPETRQLETGGASPSPAFYTAFKAAWGDAALPVGRMLVDAPSGIRIAVLAADATSATVQLSGGTLAWTPVPTPTPTQAPDPAPAPTTQAAPAPTPAAVSTPIPTRTPAASRPTIRLVAPAPGRRGTIRLSSTRRVIVSIPGAGRIQASIGTRWLSSRNGSRATFVLPRSAVARATVRFRATRGALDAPVTATLTVRRGVVRFSAR